MFFFFIFIFIWTYSFFSVAVPQATPHFAFDIGLFYFLFFFWNRVKEKKICINNNSTNTYQKRNLDETPKSDIKLNVMNNVQSWMAMRKMITFRYACRIATLRTQHKNKFVAAILLFFLFFFASSKVDLHRDFDEMR